MALFQTADGRWIVGSNRSGSEYKGFLGWRDCVIQLTASGATEESIDYLNAFRDYALAHNALGEPIMPPSVNVWISNNGTTTAVQADDLSVDGDVFTIGGIKWTGSAWDYSNAGQGSGGSGGGSGGGSDGGFLRVNITGGIGPGATLTADKTFAEILSAFNAGEYVYAARDFSVYHPFSFESNIVSFQQVSIDDSSVANLYININDDNSVSMVSTQYPNA